MARYEITVELPNGDWVWTRCLLTPSAPANTLAPSTSSRATSTEVRDYHDMLAFALDYAFLCGGRVHHIEKLST